jgi:hypothetical protein
MRASNLFVPSLGLAPFLFLFACNADTFTGADSGQDAAADVALDSPPVDGGSTEAGVTPIDPTALGSNLVLWLRAEDANYDQGTSLVFQWQDKSPHHQNVSVKTAAVTCSPAGISKHLSELNSYPAVSFCDAVAEAEDDPSLQFGTGDPFVISAVVEPGSAGTPGDYVLAEKSANPSGLSGFGLRVPNKALQFDAYLNLADSHVVTAITATGQYHIVTMVRRKGTNGTMLTLRVDGTETASAVPTQDVSEPNGPFVIGGFDTGQGSLLNVIPGKVAEVLVVTNATALPDSLPTGLELYFKQKYGL